MSSGESGNQARVSRDFALLAPRFADVVRVAIAACNVANLDAYVYEAYRSNELQQVYYARGRTVIPPLRTVTNAQTNDFSWHGYGLAVDVISKRLLWNAGDAWFNDVAAIFEQHNCHWGGHWKQRDLPHFQWAPCRPSPSDRAREILRNDGIEDVWRVVGAV